MEEEEEDSKRFVWSNLARASFCFMSFADSLSPWSVLVVHSYRLVVPFITLHYLRNL